MTKYKIAGIAATTLALALGSSTAAFADTSMASSTSASSTYQVMIMTHLCNSSIKNAQDFANLEAGKSPIAALANTVLNCPATGLAGNAAVAGTVASPRSLYNFQVMNNVGSSTSLQQNGVFMPHKICEADINVDVNNDGMISTSTCLDISHYVLTVATGTNGMLTVSETMAPVGFHFGTLRFTPNALIPNNDSQALVSTSATGTISLNMASDSDGMIMLHDYQFMDATSTGTTTGTGGGSGSGGSTGNVHLDARLAHIRARIAQLQERVQDLLHRIQLLTGNASSMNSSASMNTNTTTTSSSGNVSSGNSSSWINTFTSMNGNTVSNSVSSNSNSSNSSNNSSSGITMPATPTTPAMPAIPMIPTIPNSANSPQSIFNAMTNIMNSFGN